MEDASARFPEPENEPTNDFTSNKRSPFSTGVLSGTNLRLFSSCSNEKVILFLRNEVSYPENAITENSL